MTVMRLNACQLRCSDQDWAYAAAHADAIERHWRAARKANPKLFDGDVFVINGWSVDGGVLCGDALATKFSAYLHWRENGFDGGATAEAFATSVVRAGDGGVLLARAARGTLNGGLYVSPGGLLDRRDAGADGILDLAGAAAREMAEETGLKVAGPGEAFASEVLVRDDGFLMAGIEPYLAVASGYRSALSSGDLLARVERFLATQADPELEAPVIVHRARDLEGLAVSEFANLLTRAIWA